VPLRSLSARSQPAVARVLAAVGSKLGAKAVLGFLLSLPTHPASGQYRHVEQKTYFLVQSRVAVLDSVLGLM
jgi:hypothetical protein